MLHHLPWRVRVYSDRVFPKLKSHGRRGWSASEAAWKLAQPKGRGGAGAKSRCGGGGDGVSSLGERKLLFR
jgi:hypothetical protein